MGTYLFKVYEGDLVISINTGLQKKYHIRWSVISQDGQRQRGILYFRLNRFRHISMEALSEHPNLFDSALGRAAAYIINSILLFIHNIVLK